MTAKEAALIIKLARASGLANSLADPILSLRQAREGAVEGVAKEIEETVKEVQQELFRMFGGEDAV